MSEVLMGWGGRISAVATVHVLRSEEDVARQLASGEAMIARGLGRNDGDAAQLSGGVVLANRGLSYIGPVVDGVVTVGAGRPLTSSFRARCPGDGLCRSPRARGHVTIGGAVAADVHGKNHHVDGSFA